MARLTAIQQLVETLERLEKSLGEEIEAYEEGGWENVGTKIIENYDDIRHAMLLAQEISDTPAVSMKTVSNWAMGSN